MAKKISHQKLFDFLYNREQNNCSKIAEAYAEVLYHLEIGTFDETPPQD